MDYYCDNKRNRAVKIENKTKDTIEKIKRLKDGKIKFYQVIYEDEIDEVSKHCVGNNIISYICSIVNDTYCRILNLSGYKDEDSNFHINNHKQFKEITVFICILKGFTRDDGKFIINNRTPNIFGKIANGRIKNFFS